MSRGETEIRLVPDEVVDYYMDLDNIMSNSPAYSGIAWYEYQRIKLTLLLRWLKENNLL